MPDKTRDPIFDPAQARMAEVVRALVEIMGPYRLPAVDFSDERALLKDSGRAVMGVGEASGPGRAMRAAQLAMLDLQRQLGNAPGKSGPDNRDAQGLNP